MASELSNAPITEVTEENFEQSLGPVGHPGSSEAAASVGAGTGLAATAALWPFVIVRAWGANWGPGSSTSVRKGSAGIRR